MNPTMLEILAHSAEGPYLLDVSSKAILNAANSLAAKGLIRLDWSNRATITGEGLAALSEYHAEQKRISKQRAEDAAKHRDEYKRQLIAAVVGAVAGAITTIIIQRILGLFH